MVPGSRPDPAQNKTIMLKELNKQYRLLACKVRFTVKLQTTCGGPAHGGSNLHDSITLLLW